MPHQIWSLVPFVSSIRLGCRRGLLSTESAALAVGVDHTQDASFVRASELFRRAEIGRLRGPSIWPADDAVALAGATLLERVHLVLLAVGLGRPD